MENVKKPFVYIATNIYDSKPNSLLQTMATHQTNDFSNEFKLIFFSNVFFSIFLSRLFDNEFDTNKQRWPEIEYHYCL